MAERQLSVTTATSWDTSRETARSLVENEDRAIRVAVKNIWRKTVRRRKRKRRHKCPQRVRRS